MGRLVDTITAGIRTQRSESAVSSHSPAATSVPKTTPPSTIPAPHVGPVDVKLQTRSEPIEVQHTGPIVTTESGATSVPAFRRRLPDTELSVYPFALGCSVFGWTADGDTSMRILDRHRDLGGNFLDTADSYASGRSEVLLGAWMRSRRTRDTTVVATKIGRNRDFPGLSPDNIIGAVHASLERLGTDSIDLLYLHLDDKKVPLEESLGAIDALMRAGLVKNLAASNYSAERLMEARVLAANGLPRFVALQTHYNLVHRVDFESNLSVVTRAQGLAVMPYFALAHGFLTGKYHAKADVSGDVRGHLIAPYLNRSSLRALAALRRVAEARGVASTTIALAWLSAKGMFAPVASVSRPEQLDAIMAAAEIRLFRSEMHELDRASEKLSDLP
ncbi:aldo/keto reductase [Leifsonia sp. YAF41]|uniref:aldo/keto reductase n=1 Tax=Leifsonia sp. YAF41 TaxID=3233086 RepID=UPI003F99BA19